jgi:ribosomal protein S18 acetylase RimI-like enzyme
MIVRRTIDTDINSLAQVHVNAFKNHVNSLLGERYARAFIRWFMENDNSICLTSEIDGKQLGYVCGTALGYNQKLNTDLLWIVVRCFLLKPSLFFNTELMAIAKGKVQILLGKKSLLKDVVKNPIGAGISLVSICSDETSSYKGIGKALIDEFERHARLNGFNFMRLSVKSKNVKAISFYERNNWKLLQDKNSTLYYFKKL